MACALSYIGRPEAANAISSYALHSESLPSKEMIEYLIACMKKHAPDIATGQKWNTKKKVLKFDPVENVSTSITLLQLCGNDGGVQHAVTTVGNWIFDTVEFRAYALTKENLSVCCGEGATFERVYAAYRFDRPA